MNTGSVLAQFTITLSQAVSEQVAVEWHTADGTALAGVDYAAAKGTVLFAPGQTAKFVEILVHGRAVGSEDRSFFVEMLPPTNAILGASLGECIIHVDTTGSTPVTQIIVPTGPRGLQGDSAYQSWLDLGNTGTEQDFINSLKPSAAEIAQEVATLIDLSNSPLTAEGTETLSKPDTITGKRLARRVAYVGAAKVATVVLADGDNLITHASLSGDAVDFNSISLYPRILRGTVVISPEWSVEPADKILIKSAVSGDVLHVCQYDVISERAVKNVVDASLEPVGSQVLEALLRSYAEAGYNVAGTFQAGFTYVNANDIGIDEATGKGFTGPAGDVAAGTNPASGGFVDRSGALLRGEVTIIIKEKRRNISHYLTKAEFDDAQTGNPKLDTTAAWNAALNDSSIRALDFKGGFKVTGAGKACITQTENISLHGNNRRDTFIRADNAGANTAILDLAIANNGGMGDVRGWAAEHFSIFHNNGGSSCIINDSGLPMLECRIVDVSAQAGVTAGSRDLLMTRFAFSKVEQCSFGSGVTCGLPSHQSPDGNKFLMNNFFGTPTALILDIEAGAYRTEVYGGAMVTRDGGVRVLRGSQIAIRSVQFEQFPAYGQSQSPERAHIAILGTGQLSDSILIEGNNFGGGTNCDYLVWVNNAFDTDITKNIMNAPSVADVYTSVNAQFTKPRTDNVVKGNQSNPRPNNVRFPMVVADNGYGTYNVLHQQTALANGWLGGSFYLNELNEVVIDTGFNAGVTAPGTLIATMPDGFRPANFYALVAASSAGVGAINANPTTGALTIASAPSNSQLGCQMRFPARRG